MQATCEAQNVDYQPTTPLHDWSRPVFRLATQTRSDLTVVRVAGDLDMANAQTLAGELDRVAAQQPTLAVVNLTGVHYLSVRSMGVLQAFAQALTEHGGRLVLTGLSERVAELFRVSELDRVMDIR